MQLLLNGIFVFNFSHSSTFGRLKASFWVLSNVNFVASFEQVLTTWRKVIRIR